MFSWAPWRGPDWQGIECLPFAKLPAPPCVKLLCLGKSDLSSSFRLPRCCQPRSVVAALVECWCSHQYCLSERLGTPNLASVDAPESCEPGFPYSLPFSILPFPVQLPWRQPVDLGLPGCCWPTSFPCCSTLEALLCFSLLSRRALLEDYVVAADEHLTEYSHGKFRLGISGRSGFQSDFLLLWRGRN